MSQQGSERSSGMESDDSEEYVPSEEEVEDEQTEDQDSSRAPPAETAPVQALVNGTTTSTESAASMIYSRTRARQPMNDVTVEELDRQLADQVPEERIGVTGIDDDDPYSDFLVRAWYDDDVGSLVDDQRGSSTGRTSVDDDEEFRISPDLLDDHDNFAGKVSQAELSALLDDLRQPWPPLPTDANFDAGSAAYDLAGMPFANHDAAPPSASLTGPTPTGSSTQSYTPSPLVPELNKLAGSAPHGRLDPAAHSSFMQPPGPAPGDTSGAFGLSSGSGMFRNIVPNNVTQSTPLCMFRPIHLRTLERQLRTYRQLLTQLTAVAAQSDTVYTGVTTSIEAADLTKRCTWDRAIPKPSVTAHQLPTHDATTAPVRRPLHTLVAPGFGIRCRLVMFFAVLMPLCVRMLVVELAQDLADMHATATNTAPIELPDPADFSTIQPTPSHPTGPSLHNPGSIYASDLSHDQHLSGQSMPPPLRPPGITHTDATRSAPPSRARSHTTGPVGPLPQSFGRGIRTRTAVAAEEALRSRFGPWGVCLFQQREKSEQCIHSIPLTPSHFASASMRSTLGVLSDLTRHARSWIVEHLKIGQGTGGYHFLYQAGFNDTSSQHQQLQQHQYQHHRQHQHQQHYALADQHYSAVSQPGQFPPPQFSAPGMPTSAAAFAVGPVPDQSSSLFDRSSHPSSALNADTSDRSGETLTATVFGHSAGRVNSLSLRQLPLFVNKIAWNPIGPEVVQYVQPVQHEWLPEFELYSLFKQYVGGCPQPVNLRSSQ